MSRAPKRVEVINHLVGAGVAADFATLVADGLHWTQRRKILELPAETVVALFRSCGGESCPVMSDRDLLEQTELEGEFFSARFPHLTMYLGTPQIDWLRKTTVPLFISHRRLKRAGGKRRNISHLKAKGRWALDSGGFTELSMFGRWTESPEAYAADVRRYHDQIGGLDFASIQDWMCEEFIIEGGVIPESGGKVAPGTGKTLREHQLLTVESFLTLTELDSHLPWLPVIQGFTVDDYLRNIGDYADAGVNLFDYKRVGVGSVCRRQKTDEITELLRELWNAGLHQMHGFGVKTQGLYKAGQYLRSADSTSWSGVARNRRTPANVKRAKKAGKSLPSRGVKLNWCEHVSPTDHKVCNSCREWADIWINDLGRKIDNLPQKGVCDALCPSCGTDEEGAIRPPSHDFYGYSCTSCGFAWPLETAGELDPATGGVGDYVLSSTWYGPGSRTIGYGAEYEAAEREVRAHVEAGVIDEEVWTEAKAMVRGRKPEAGQTRHDLLVDTYVNLVLMPPPSRLPRPNPR